MRKEKIRLGPTVRSIVVTWIFLTLCAPLYSGEIKFMGGPAIGKYSASWMTNRFKTGYLFGIGTEFGSGRISYGLDILYFLKTNDYVSRGWEYELREISLPAVVKMKLFPRRLPVFVLAGGEIAYILSHKQNPGGIGGTWDATEFTRKVDYGLVFGTGLEFEIGGGGWEIEGRYHHGLANTTKFVNDKGYQFQTRELALVLGIKFKL